jgi:NhaP-type Na+/H+ and K+/H+ antiporter
MIKKRYASMMAIRAPETVEEFYKKNAKNKLQELSLDIPPEVLSQVFKLKKPYKTSLMSVSTRDKEIIDQIAEERGIARGDVLLAILLHNFPEEVKKLFEKEETNNGKETKE